MNTDLSNNNVNEDESVLKSEASVILSENNDNNVSEDKIPTPKNSVNVAEPSSTLNKETIKVENEELDLSSENTRNSNLEDSNQQFLSKTNTYDDNLLDDDIIEYYEQSDKNNSLANENNKLKSLLHVNQLKINELEDFQEENEVLRTRIDKLENSQGCNCTCKNCKSCKHKNNNKLTESVQSDHVNILNEPTSLSSLDPFKLLLNLLIIEKEIREKLKSIVNNFNNYQHNLKLNTQDKDDLIFYQSIITDSKNYLINSYKIRKKKLIFDLNEIIKMFNDKTMPNMNELNKDIINIIKKTYNKLAKEVEDNNSNNSKPVWIKNDKLRYIKNIKIEMNRTFLYHTDILNHLKKQIVQEINFFKI